MKAQFVSLLLALGFTAQAYAEVRGYLCVSVINQGSKKPELVLTSAAEGYYFKTKNEALEALGVQCDNNNIRCRKVECAFDNGADVPEKKIAWLKQEATLVTAEEVLNRLDRISSIGGCPSGGGFSGTITVTEPADEPESRAMRNLREAERLQAIREGGRRRR